MARKRRNPAQDRFDDEENFGPITTPDGQVIPDSERTVSPEQLRAERAARRKARKV